MTLYFYDLILLKYFIFMIIILMMELQQSQQSLGLPSGGFFHASESIWVT